VGAALAILPDFDYVLYLGLGLDEGWHRTFTHSIVFAIAAGTLAAALRHSKRPRMALVYSLATLSHPILDLFTSDTGGVELFWPFSTRRLRFGLINYKELIGRAPRPLLPIIVQVLTTSAVEFAVFAPILLAALWINRITTKPDS
jgi:membrane-bound metal-dependent hydrolase YbcI (DUF457 family)